MPIQVTVNTNNKTGYTITLNSETDENALVNTNSITNAKIDSISSASALNNFSNNTWGVKFGANSNFSPIPKLTSPTNIAQTTAKTNGNETTDVKLGMKLGNNLESGSYKNKLIFSILTNRYDPIAKMTTGSNFNSKLKSLETVTNKIEHFKKSTTVPIAAMNAVNIEDPGSDYEIKLWLDPTDKTAYYYTESEKVYLNERSYNMFYNMPNLTSLDLSNFDTSKVTNMGDMFYGMSNLTSLNLSNFDTSKVTNMGWMFYRVSNLTSLDLSNFDTSKVTYMNQMFYGMSNLTSLNLSNFNTAKVIDMEYMFSEMYRLTSLDLSNFDTSEVTSMHCMFYYVSNLTSLNISNFNTSKVTNMNRMFSGMYGLTSLDLSNFDTSNVTDMELMFSDMPSLTSLNLSNFNTSKVTDMKKMFYSMPKLVFLDLSNFNTSNVTDMTGMFALANGYSGDLLEKIYVNNDFDTTKLQSYTGIFESRMKLRGGAGSYLTNTYDANKSWLRIDDPSHGRPGYFTRKP